jgi:peptidoglycan hydrolase-like protein with peptidoglycan-binding domain
LGSATLDESFDLGSLDFARYIKIIDTSDPANFGGTADGYDIDAISAVECGFPEPVTCFANQIVSVSQGLKKNGNAVDTNRSNPLHVLGAPQHDDTLNFYSLGFGGEMVVAFDLPILNLSGDDIVLTETTFGNRSYESYPETAAVFASQNGVGWVFLGFAEHDASFDLGSLSWAQYIKIVDISETDAFGPSDDAFDIDALEALCGYPESYDEEHDDTVEEIPNDENPDDTYDEEDGTGDETENNDDTSDPDDTNEEESNDRPTRRSGGSSSGGSIGTSGLVLGAFDAQDDELGMVLGEFDARDGTCGIYLTQFLRRGVQNDTGEVRKLQEFLNLHMNAGLMVDGIFGIQTEQAVNTFQLAYWEEILAPWAPYGFPEVMKPSGWVYKTTQRKINMIHCPSLNLPIPPLP